MGGCLMSWYQMFKRLGRLVWAGATSCWTETCLKTGTGLEAVVEAAFVAGDDGGEEVGAVMGVRLVLGLVPVSL